MITADPGNGGSRCLSWRAANQFLRANGRPFLYPGLPDEATPDRSPRSLELFADEMLAGARRAGG
jgi:hypothetical protein